MSNASAPSDPADASGPSGAVAAIVLAGGSGRRLGGVDKAALERSPAARCSTVPWQRSAPRVRWSSSVRPGSCPDGILGTREQPPGGGPVAAVAAGLDALAGRADSGFDLVVVLACDMPFVDEAAVSTLVRAARAAGPDVDGAAYVDGDGRRQHLAAAYGVQALTDAIGSLGQVERRGHATRRRTLDDGRDRGRS